MKNLSIIGCGDFLRWQTRSIQKSKSVSVRWLYDPDQARAEKHATTLRGRVAVSAESIIEDPETDVVALFVPPWVRPPLAMAAAAAGKHLILTKPLAPQVADCDLLLQAVSKARVRAGVIYSRTDDPFVEAIKDLLQSGQVGRLALYRQDWIHSYPRWNAWATDPGKNGGPFMDAMIHNLNAANYLMDRPVDGSVFFSDRLVHQHLACADTEQMLVRYAGGGLTHLFITWAADLATHGTDGNDREHIDHLYLVTSDGWHLSKEWKDGQCRIRASRAGEVKLFPVPGPAATSYDRFVETIDQPAQPLPRVWVALEQARDDIARIRARPSVIGPAD